MSSSSPTAEAPPSADTPCIHCNTLCGNTGVTENNKPFCCHGCAMVYAILSENGLDRFYDLDENPGVRADNAAEAGMYDFLADPEVKRKLIDFTDGHTTRVSFHLPQIHCVACIWLLERLYKLHDGIGKPEVNFTRKTLTVPFNEEKTNLVEIASLLSRLGYPPEFRLENLNGKPVDKARRRAWMQLGIAGFAFGNIMLLSFPHYLGLHMDDTPWAAPLFGGISLILSLPVLLYSAQDYFRSAWLGIRHGEMSIDVPIALGIIALFVQSTMDILWGWGEGYLDSLAGLVFFLLIGKSFQRRSFDALSFDRDYTSYFPLAALRIHPDGSRQTTSLDTLEPGHRICIRNGELIPADAILIQGPALVDYSFVTGESKPEERLTGDTLYAGGRHHGAPIEVDVIKEVSHSYLTSLWNHQSFRKENEQRFDQMTRKVSQVFTIVVLAIALGAAIIWCWIDASQAMRILSAILIVACPCALALSAPFAFGTALRVLRPYGLYLKNGFVIEGMARVRHLAFDKTGTLTHGGLGTVRWYGQDLDIAQQSAIKGLAASSTHPLSRAIAASILPPETLPETMQELLGKGIEGTLQGQTIRVGSAAWLQTCGLHLPDVPAGIQSWVAIQDQILGGYIFEDSPREGMVEAITSLNQKYDISVLTGDREAGLEKLHEWFPGCVDARSELSPSDKLTAIDHLRADGKAVMMLGDGLNDAGALRHSDVGVAVTENIQAFSPACDAILDARHLPHLPQFLKFSRFTTKVVMLSFTVSLLYNVVGISIAASGHLSPLIAAILMPLSSVTVLLISVLCTRLAAKICRLT
ncbi:heavy metal translocating P-type ATPase metal-binding domain-containing protein [Kiritimatiellota bacterium B12222]|nr:heavy metal translocating P-type ATPase metal-binding domain-containing protein [Kiritimatiellota bacterium B12222]